VPQGAGYQCQEVRPVDWIPVNPEYAETKDQTYRKYLRPTEQKAKTSA
jgi:hypothetical protein